jgi:hypothetical protein
MNQNLKNAIIMGYVAMALLIVLSFCGGVAYGQISVMNKVNKVVPKALFVKIHKQLID